MFDGMDGRLIGNWSTRRHIVSQAVRIVDLANSVTLDCKRY